MQHQENTERMEFNIYNNAYRKAAIKLARTASTLFPLLQGISSISLLILLALGTYQLEWIYFDSGLVFNTLCRKTCFSYSLLGFTLNTFQLGQVSLDRVEEIFKNKPNIVDDLKANFKKKGEGLLEAKNLTLKYPGSNLIHLMVSILKFILENL